MKKKILSTANFLIILILLLFFSACGTPDLELPVEYPQDAYAIDSLTGSDNGSYELDEEELAEVVERIEKGRYGNIHSLVIIHNDSLVLEEYFREWTRHMLHPCYSVTKSFTSALIGIAIEQGYINGVDDKLLGFFTEYDDIENLDQRKKSITLEHVLTMSSGFEWDEISVPYVDRQGNPNYENDVIELSQSSDWIKHMLDVPMNFDPGSEFVYNSGGTHLLSGILTHTTGQSAEDFAEGNLFKALGITDWEWESDPNGITVTGWGLSLHPVNMAMLGYLYLKNGRLNGQQIVPEDWVEESTAKHTVIDNFVWIMNGKMDYGYQWWRFNDSMFDTMWRGDPPKVNDLFNASGFGGQYIYIVPHLDMVVVITAWEPTKMQYPAILFNDVYNTVKEK